MTCFMLNVPPLFPCISFEIMNITLQDAGFYSVGTTDYHSSIDRAVFFNVTGNNFNVANVMRYVNFSKEDIFAGFFKVNTMI